MFHSPTYRNLSSHNYKQLSYAQNSASLNHNNNPFFVRTIPLWYALSDYIVTAHYVDSFKVQVLMFFTLHFFATVFLFVFVFH